MDALLYIKQKAAGLVSAARVGAAFALTWQEYQSDGSLTSHVEAIDIVDDIDARLTALAEETAAWQQLKADLEALP